MRSKKHIENNYIAKCRMCNEHKMKSWTDKVHKKRKRQENGNQLKIMLFLTRYNVINQIKNSHI